MKTTITEYGAAEQVPGSKIILKLDDGNKYKNILIDIGNEYENQESGNINAPPKELPFNSKSIDTLLLTHAHADHMGELLQLHKKGFKGKIYATPLTADIAKTQMDQTIMAPFFYNRNIKGKRFEKGPRTGQFIPFMKSEYVKEDLEEIMTQFVPLDGTSGIPIGKKIFVDKNIQATFYEAGHIPGSAQVLLEINQDGKQINVLTSFDLGRTDYQLTNHPIANTPLVKFPQKDFPKKIDYIIIESTYGNKTHAPLEESVAILEQAANDAAKNKGVLVIPAFSIMRTHMLWNFLYNLEKENRLPKNMKFYTSSPGAEIVADIILKHYIDLDEQGKQEFANKTYNPFNFPSLIHHEKGKQTEAVLQDENLRPFGVIAASGMCDKGRIEKILTYTVSDPRNIILLTGYAAPGTRSELLMRKEPMIPFFEKDLPLKADVRKMGGLSGHADKVEMIAHLKHINPDFKGIFIKHGEKECCYALRDEIIKSGYSPEVVHVMKKGQSYEL